MSSMPNGRQINVDFTDVDGIGHLACEVGYVNSQIDSAIANHIGGWLNSDEATYQAALKKKEKSPSSQRKKPWFRPDPSLAQKAAVGARKGVEIPAAPKPDPLSVPTPEEMRPRSGVVPREVFA